MSGGPPPGEFKFSENRQHFAYFVYSIQKWTRKETFRFVLVIARIRLVGHLTSHPLYLHCTRPRATTPSSPQLNTGSRAESWEHLLGSLDDWKWIVVDPWDSSSYSAFPLHFSSPPTFPLCCLYWRTYYHRGVLPHCMQMNGSPVLANA